ncbi:LysR family transcriptional regulator [Georgenia sp. H159]|uniref:LysR family transcriptional regulator n=1 Tax=Georgenia sp. H159 TaxID=3076115 RepID=UPI002D779B4A|nr:LysR family transcriptional regulator [Georgenia sp. H159]
MAPPRYTLRQLAYFVAVADTGSVSAAATRLHVSPTAVSAAMTQLEKVLRTQLMVRRKAHGVSLTPAGTYLYSRAQGLLQEAEELELSVASGGQVLRGPLVIGCYVTVAATVVPPLMEGFAAEHPQVDLSFVTGTQDEIPLRLLDGELDLAVVYDMDLPEGLHMRVLFETAAYVLLPAGHRLADAPEVALADLAADPMILLDAPPSSRHTMTLFDRDRVTPHVAHRTTDYELTRSLVARGFGYAILVQRPAGDLSFEGLPVVARPIVPAVPPVQVLIVWAQGTRLTDRARAMIAYAPQVRFPRIEDPAP